MMLVALLPVQAQMHWSFDQTNALQASDGHSLLQLHTVKKNLELVKGIEGKGVRTDGYSTWLTAELQEGIDCVAGYFALESFPTDTASLIGIKGKQHSIAVCVDRFGELQLEIGNTKNATCYSLQHQVRRYEWFHVALSVVNGSPVVALNGETCDMDVPEKGDLTGFSTLLIGKGFYEKRIGMYDITAINGLIDEICVNSKMPAVAEMNDLLKQTPVLAVPEIRFANDFSRPKYHLLPAANWTNETHGLFFHNGKYHIFNQKNASSILLRQINWGHFSSPDLLHWTEEKPALTPDSPYDKNGIWSGCAVIDDAGIPRLFYTSGGDKMGVGMASPKDETLVEWVKSDLNPIIEEKPAMYSRTDMRDQYVWKEGNVWYMIIGFGLEKVEQPHGTLLLYKSEDLEHWAFVHLLFEGNPAVDQSCIFWEMPVFKKMGNKYVLLVNRVPHKGVPARTQYWVGDFKNEKFIPDSPIPQNLEVINRLLSPSVVDTPDGQVAAIAIIPDEIGTPANYENGWAHLYSMPRIWRLKDGKICQSPHPIMKELRKEYQHFSKQALSNSDPLVISKEGHQLEMEVTFHPHDAKQFGIVLCKNSNKSEYTKIYYDVIKQELVVDQTYSSKRKYIPLRVRKDTYHLDTSMPVTLHLFVDGSVVEGFINGEDAFTTRIFPLETNSSQVELFADGNQTEVEVNLWKLAHTLVGMNF